MFKNKDESERFLKEVADKLTVTTHQLSEAAKRLQLAELTYKQYLMRLRQLEEQMRGLTDMLRSQDKPRRARKTNPAFCDPPEQRKDDRKRLRYADYIEFSNYSELRKFEKMDEISRDDLAECDTDELMRQLLEDIPPGKS